ARRQQESGQYGRPPARPARPHSQPRPLSRRRSITVPEPPRSTTSEPPIASASPWPFDAVGTPVLGAPEGTAVIWLLGSSGLGWLGVVLPLRVGMGRGIMVGGADGVLDTGVGVAVGALSANAVPAPAPIPTSTAVHARVVSRLRVRMGGLSPRSIRGGS